MKKTVIMIFAVMLVAVSLVSGTFALYTTSTDGDSADITAKSFTFTSTVDTAFTETGVKLAPTESKSYTFTIANFSGETITEVDTDVVITPTLTSDITPLTIKVYEGETEVTGAVRFSANTATTKTFTVVVSWPSTTGDEAFAGLTASFNVAIVGTQVAA